jgi:hypothetical protein
MEPPQPPRTQPVSDRVRRDPLIEELPPSDNTMLHLGEAVDRRIDVTSSR